MANEKPVALDMEFDEALRRLINVPKSKVKNPPKRPKKVGESDAADTTKPRPFKTIDK